MKRMEVTDITGRTWKSDPDVDGELTPTAIAQIAAGLKNFGEITTLNLSIGGAQHYFNAAHLIAWAITDGGDDE